MYRLIVQSHATALVFSQSCVNSHMQSEKRVAYAVLQLDFPRFRQVARLTVVQKTLCVAKIDGSVTDRLGGPSEQNGPQSIVPSSVTSEAPRRLNQQMAHNLEEGRRQMCRAA